ncbi:hypothetical protein BD410DRAFT_819897 [Rickenella mellea]|uniref:CNH domain-containing protein n=1 Tax=Rickenella mellea TaxID=50990 RepID=A0A4Y7QCL6_9AGAM|nr:hypothetical protein BD410DRAFT_819897 [Rickenella mellea]
MSSVNPAEVPPFQLQQLISTVIQQNVSSGRRDSRVPAEVTCAQALGSEIYIGCSDGSLMRFALQADDPNSPESYKILSQQTLPTNKPIDEIVLTPSISRALILSAHQIHIYSIPSLDPVQINPIRNVIHFAVDDRQLHRVQPSVADQLAMASVEPVEFAVIKRSSIALFSLTDRLIFHQDIPIPQPGRLARRTGNFLCMAGRDTYDLIDLHHSSSLSVLPISQASFDGPPPPPIKPSITVVGENEFLLLTSLGESTIGVFVTGEGDPTRSPLEWPAHPDAVCVDYPYVAALLPNHSIEIHNLEASTLVQVITPPPTSPGPSPTAPEPRSLLAACMGFLVPSTQRTEKLRLVRMPLITLPPRARSPPVSPPRSPPSRSRTASPRQPKPPNHPPSPVVRPPVFPRATVLVLCANGVQCLLPSTLISQAEALLSAHRIEDALELAEQNARKMLGSSQGDEDQAEELRYVHQRAGMQLLSETRFEDAGRALLAGDADPRILIRLFPDLRGSLFNPEDTLDVFAGVAEHLPPQTSIDEIVVDNLVRNYSPHLKPDTRSAPPTAELRRILTSAARDMLKAYLRKCRTRRLLERANGNKEMNAVVDTVLVKILAESEETAELYTLLDGAHDVVLQEVEQPLVKNGQYNALCKLYVARGDEGKLLEAWQQLADGVWTDEDISNPLERMVELLQKTSNWSLAQQWGIWLVGKDADLGLKLLIARDSRRSSKADDVSMLERIRAADESAGTRFLEYLVLQKRSNDPDLHEQLATSCINQLTQALSDDTIAKLWRAKASSYASSPTDTPFLSYFASTTPESPSKLIRLKTALFLQGSSHYSFSAILDRIQPHATILRLERAILFGQLGRHADALGALVNDVKDAASAEAYCTLGGVVVPAKVALAIGERHGLQRWATLVAGTKGINASASMERQKSADGGTQRELLRVLLGVYMSGGKATADRTARLLNSQAINLDVADVLALVPPDWPLNALSSFLARSFRRTLHTEHEGALVKAICEGQNLEISDRTYEILRSEGAVIEEPASDEEDDGDGGDVNEKEKADEGDSVHDSDEVPVVHEKDARLSEKVAGIVLADGGDGGEETSLPPPPPRKESLAHRNTSFLGRDGLRTPGRDVR